MRLRNVLLGGAVNDNQLRYFRALYSIGNAHAAADSIPLSRQGLIKSLETLEAELGVPLFDDKAAPVCRPTEYGEAFWQYADRCKTAFEDLMHEFRRIEASRSGLIKIGASIGVMGLIGIDLFKKFELKLGGARIELDEVPDANCDSGILSGNYGLGFTVAPYRAEFETVELYSTDRSIWVSSKDPLSHRDELTIEDLDGYHIGVVSKSFKNYSCLIELCEKSGVYPGSVDTFSEMTQLYRHAMRPRCVSFTAPHVARLFSDLFSESVEPVREVPFRGMPWSFGISHDKRHVPTEAERAFIDYCAAFFRGLKRG